MSTPRFDLQLSAPNALEVRTRSHQRRRRFSVWSLVLTLLAGLSSSVVADDPLPQPAGGTTGGTSPKPADLTIEQQRILKDFQAFEEELANVAEAMRSSDLDRANLLFQARSESQKSQVAARMNEIVAILSEKRPYADAVERQRAVVRELEALLKILQTDAERDRVQQRIKELEEILKETNRLIATQKDVRADTERGREFGDLETREQRIAREAGDLAEKIRRQDDARSRENGQASPSDTPGGQSTGQDPAGEGAEPSPSETPNGEKPDESDASNPPREGESPGEKSDSSEKPEPGEMPPSGSDPSRSEESPGQPSEVQQSQGQQSQGQQSQGEQSEEVTPGREELEQARREMQQAIEELKKQNRDGASDEQDQAIAQLEQMKAQIEEILRQLRMEERELYLTMLEARFQEMLQLQLRINADTVRLDVRDESERGEAHFTKSRDLSQKEQQNVLAAEKALALLKEEGSSVAFPEAVEQMKSNMETVTDRLARGDTGETTRLVERMIVESLEEMIFSLQQELEKIKEQQQQGQQQGQPQDPPLVDVLAELKMVRSLQSQVNRLTRQIGLEIEGEQASSPEQLQLLEDLARRQQRIQEATYDLSTGRNE